MAEEALIITALIDYVLEGADVHLFLAELEVDEGQRLGVTMPAK